jgi:protein phosphatase
MDPAAAVIRVPDPCLVVLVGAAGAGKSTFATRWFAAGEILSSDAFRERIAGDPADQQATGPAFAALHRALRRRLAAGRLTVVDATSVQPGARAALLRDARAAGIPAVAIAIDLPRAIVLARNAGRAGGRVVPEAAVRAQLADLRATLAGGRLVREGFAAVWRLADPADVDRVVVERLARRSPVEPGLTPSRGAGP